MSRIEKEITFGWDDDAWDLQDKGLPPGDPIVPDCLHFPRRGVSLPVSRQRGNINLGDQFRIDPNWKGHIVLQQLSGIEMHQDFQGCQGLRLCRINNRYALRVPAASVAPRAFAIESESPELSLDDSPSSDAQAKTPCSKLPIRSST